MSKHAKKSSAIQRVDPPSPISVQVPLPLLGRLQDLEHAFFELCVHVGQRALEEMMEADRERLCGPKGRHQPDRAAFRAGSTRSDVALGGRRIGIRRPRVRGPEGEIALPSFAWAAAADPLDQRTMEAVACGVSTRKYAPSLEALPD